MRAVAARNPIVSHLRRLSGRRRARLAAGEFVLEGPAVVREVLDAAVPLRALVVDEAAYHERDELRASVAVAESQGVDVVALPAGVLERVTDTITSQGIAAIVPLPHASLDELTAVGGLVVVLDGVSDPGNVGTIIRSASGAGAVGLIVGDGTADPFAPKAVRAAAGALFRIPVVVESAPRAITALRAAGWRAIGTDAAAAVAYSAVDLTGSVALVVGSEAHGMSWDVRETLDSVVRIPLASGLESLNVAVAAAVVCFEAARQAGTG